MPSKSIKQSSDQAWLRRIATPEGTNYGYGRAKMVSEIIKALPISRNKRVLDIGCGSGELMKMIQSLGHEIKGLDASGIAIKICKEKQLDVIQWDLNEPLPFGDKEFDIVTCTEVIEHLCDPSSVLSEIKRVLKDEGFLTISAPNEYDWYHRLRILFGKSIDWHPWAPTTHLHKCNFYEFMSFLAEEGVVNKFSESIYAFWKSIHTEKNSTISCSYSSQSLRWVGCGYCKKER